MATDTQIAQRTAQALSRINEAVRQLSEQFPSVEAPELPTRHRYPEMLALTQMTSIADFLDGLVAATEGTWITGEVGEIQVPDGWTEMHRLFTVASDNEMLRDVLVDAGFMQARQDEGENGDWSFTWLDAEGNPLGPDLVDIIPIEEPIEPETESQTTGKPKASAKKAKDA